MRRTRDPEIAADLMAETFAAALVSLGRFQPSGAPASASEIAQEQGVAESVIRQRVSRGLRRLRTRLEGRT